MQISFLMCSERSGSNLILKMLDSHSTVCGPTTKHIINPVARNLFRYENITDEENWKSLIVDIKKLMDVKFSVWKSSPSLAEMEAMSSIGDISTLIQNLFLEEARANGKQNVFIKENQLYEFLPFLLLNFPEAKYIYQVRDPRDMALSWKKNPDHPGGIVVGAKHWQKDQQNTLKNYNELRKRGKALLIKYEDLIEFPKQSLEKVCNFLNISFEESMLEYYKDDLTRKNSKMQQGWNNLGKAILTGNKRKYATELNAEEIMVIEKICYLEMTHLGYIAEFDEKEIAAVGINKIQLLEKHEMDAYPAKRSNGVRMNMDAKKTFYQRKGIIQNS